jgi:hypothetical protein
MKDFISLDLFSASEGRIQCLKLANRSDDFTAKAIRQNGLQALDLKGVRQSPTKSEKVPLEEEVRSKNVEDKREEKKDAAPKVATDFSVMNMSDQEVAEVKRIRRANKGGAISQRVANELSKQFELANNLGFTIDQILTEWEVRGWKSFKSEWMPKPENGGRRVINMDSEDWARGGDDLL